MLTAEIMPAVAYARHQERFLIRFAFITSQIGASNTFTLISWRIFHRVAVLPFVNARICVEFLERDVMKLLGFR